MFQWYRKQYLTSFYRQSSKGDFTFVFLFFLYNLTSFEKLNGLEKRGEDSLWVITILHESEIFEVDQFYSDITYAFEIQLETLIDNRVSLFSTMSIMITTLQPLFKTLAQTILWGFWMVWKFRDNRPVLRKFSGGAKNLCKRHGEPQRNNEDAVRRTKCWSESSCTFLILVKIDLPVLFVHVFIFS